MHVLASQDQFIKSSLCKVSSMQKSCGDAWYILAYGKAIIASASLQYERNPNSDEQSIEMSLGSGNRDNGTREMRPCGLIFY